MTIELHGERLALRPDRSLLWPRAGALVVADPHFGKAAAFRAAGVPVPGRGEETLARLAATLAATGANRLIVLGDFWHAREGRSVRDDLTAWRSRHPDLRIDLVRGNHDRAGPPPAGWGEWVNEVVEPPFVFAHFPDPSPAGYVLAGHLHPGVVLAGRGRQRLRLPCFWFGERVGVLPAFGEFTGAAGVPVRVGDRVFAVAGSEVVETSLFGRD